MLAGQEAVDRWDVIAVLDLGFYLLMIKVMLLLSLNMLVGRDGLRQV